MSREHPDFHTKAFRQYMERPNPFFQQFIRNKTMRVEVFNDPDAGDTEKVLRLALRADGPSSGRVKLVAVRENGQSLPCGNLLTINTDGTIRLSGGVTAPGIRGSMKVVRELR